MTSDLGVRSHCHLMCGERKTYAVNANADGDFEDLDCWQAGRVVRRFVRQRVFPILPHEERYRLGDQLIRAARSITANIAEGYGRYHYPDKSKFCSIAHGSCTEVLDHLITANDEAMIPDELLREARVKIGSARRLINGYMRYLRRMAERQQTRGRQTRPDTPAAPRAIIRSPTTSPKKTNRPDFQPPSNNQPPYSPSQPPAPNPQPPSSRPQERGVKN
jgi:four helix bundle protein